MKPRKEAYRWKWEEIQVDERITTLSYEAHMKYTNKDWFIGAKSVLGSNLTQASGLGGFGIESIDERTGEQKYTQFVFPARGSTLSMERSGNREFSSDTPRTWEQATNYMLRMEKHNFTEQVQISTNW